MTDPVPPKRRKWWKYLLSLVLLSLIALGGLAWYASSDSFHEYLRRRLTLALEDMTGGRVEIGQFHTIPMRLRVEVLNLTIHGKEGAGEVPYLHVDRLQAQLKIISLFEKEVGLSSLSLDRPVVHIIVYPDGSTNQPELKIKPQSKEKAIDQVFSLAVSRVEIQKGELLWQMERIPFDFHGKDLSLAMRYSFLRRRYEAQVGLGAVATQYQQYPAVEWRADASLALFRDRADITSLTVSSGRSQVHFAGEVKNFENPQVTGSYRGVVEVGDWSTFLGLKEMRRGTANFEGKGSWNREEFSTDGTLLLTDFDWLNAKEKIEHGTLATNYSITPQRLRLTSAKMTGLGGELAGEVDVTNWQASLQSQPKERRRVVGKVPMEGLQRGSMRLHLSGFSLTPLIRALSSKKVPLEDLRMAGTASGDVEILWVGSIDDAETRVQLAVSAPSKPRVGELPVRGSVRGIYRGSRDELQLDDLQWSTPATEIKAKGNLAATSSLGFSVNSKNVGELMPLLRPQVRGRLPFAVHGWMNFTGSATGKLSSFMLAGNLEVYDFETTVPASGERQAKSVHWDSLTGAIQYSNSGISIRNGSLIHGHTLLHVDASANLVKGEITDNSSFTARVEARNLDIAEAEALAGYQYPLSGTAHLNAHASGTIASPHGEGRLEIHDASAYGTAISSLRSDLRLADGELQFNNIDTNVFGAAIGGSASTSLDGQRFRANLSGRDLSLAAFPRLQGKRITADGKVDFSVRGSGTIQHPSLEGHVHVRDLALDKERLGDLYVDASTQGIELTLQARSEFDKANLSIKGTVDLQPNFPAKMDIAFRDLDVDSLMKVYLGDRVTSHSQMRGTIKLNGPLRDPKELMVSATLDSLSAEIEHVQVATTEPIQLEFANHVLRLQNLHVAGSGTDFSAHGTARLAEAREMDFRLDGTVNMALLQTINPKIYSRGTVNVNLSATGTVAQPILQGKLELKEASISHNDFPSGLSALNGVLQFEQNRIRIEQLSGVTGGGTVSLTGAGGFEKGVVNLDVSARARDVRLRYPPGVSSTANANLRLTGNSNAALLSGEVVVTKLSITPGFDFGSYLERSKQSVSIVSTESLESHLRLDVHVTTTPELQMQTAIAKISGDADLRLRGTLDRPVVTGRANTTQGSGEIFFNGTKYTVERAEVTFPNPARTEAYVDLRATTRVRNYDITINITGNASQPNGLKATWRSDPPLPETDVISLLALGRTAEESAALQANGGSGFSGEASNLIISQALSSAVGSRLQRLFGVSRIKIDPQGLATATNVVRGPQVTIEHEVASNVTVTYSTNVSVASQQIIQVEYNVTRNLSIVALRDQNGVVSFDLKIRRRKK